MKKIKMGFLALMSFVFSGISFSQAPTASGNVMNFSAVASYEPYADDESTWASLRTIAEQSTTLTTIAEQEAGSGSEPDTLYPEFLKEVLNTDDIFQIGNYLIKIDLVNDRGLVIAAGNFNAYADLVNNNLSATGMMVLSGDEDLGLELLEALANNTTNPSDYQSFLNANRPCPGARRKTDKDNREIWRTEFFSVECENAQSRVYFMDNKVVYQKFIFWFRLQSKLKSKVVCDPKYFYQFIHINNFVDLKLEGTVKYRKRCGPESNLTANIEDSYFGGNRDGEISWMPYSSGRSLSHYDFSVQFGIRDATDRNPNPPPYVLSRPYNIKWGY